MANMQTAPRNLKQKTNLKEQFAAKTGDKTHPQDESAMNHMSRADIIARNKSPQRRVISGASIEKKGQRDNE